MEVTTTKDRILKAAKEHAETLKERYDLLFASQLVSKLDDLGLLKKRCS